MTTIVRHRRTGNQYIWLGINGEGNKTNPSRFINELFNSSQAKSEVSCSATVCDVQGNIFLAYIDDLVVVEIDGKKPADILPAPKYNSEPDVSYQKSVSDFDDEELEEGDFENEEIEEIEEKRVIITPNPESSGYSKDQSSEGDLDEDDEEWI